MRAVQRFAIFTAASLSLAGAMAPKAQAETPLERGTYLMHSIVACGNCHTPKTADGTPVPGKELSGGNLIDAPVFQARPSNLTPDKETGIGSWTDEQIVTAIREGHRPDGTLIGLPMPIDFYHGMSDTDVHAVVAYLRSVKPMRNKVAPSTYKIPLPRSYGPKLTHVADVPRANHLAYGRYLATSLGHCMDCHTPKKNGFADFKRLGAGGNPFGTPSGAVAVSANLTPANPTGIAGWTDQQVKTAITTGRRPDGPLAPVMAFHYYKNISSADLNDLVLFLRSLKPANP